ncbi:MAG: AAA family ATPase, partial [Okeania sp. SIO3C4]|nr:AAA family ATPase [Okeania sp. SIO3C4]
EVIPELEKIIGEQPTVPELSGSAAQNRFNLLFQKFIQVFATESHPLVIFIDDLQWADTASLKLMQLLMERGETGYLLLLGAYRDNEVFAAHPLMLSLDEIAKSGATLNTITLSPLSKTDLNYLVTDTLSCEKELALPLTELVYEKTKGNPFFATQFLKGLYDDGWISFNFDVGYWQCDMTRVRELTLTDDVVEFMATRLQKLPKATQEILKLAACIGNKFDLGTLAVVSEQSIVEVASCLWGALQEGLVLPISQTYKFFQGANQEEKASVEDISVGYKFLHDRVQQAAYSLIPDEQKQIAHLKIGQLLLNNTPAIELDENLFEIVNQLNIGKSLAIKPQQIQLAELNLKAGQKARTATAYATAYQYAMIGIDLLNSSQMEHSGWQAYYDLTLPLYELAAETAYLNGDMTRMEEWADIVLQQAKNATDKMGTYATKIQAYMAQVKKLEALKIGLEALELLGVSFPESPTSADIEQALTQTASNLQGKEIGGLINLPIMTDAEKLAIAKILASVGPPTFQAARSFFPLVICELVNLSLKYGNSPFSGYGYACYGIFLNAVFQDPESAYQFGQLALNISQCFNAPDMKSSVFMAVGVCTIHIKVHVKEALPILHEGYQSGLEGGNFEFPAYAAANKCQYLYLLGQELSSLEREMETINDALARFKQDNALAWNQIFQQSIMNLLYPPENPCYLEGMAYNEKISLPQLQDDDYRSDFFYVYLNKLILCYLFEDYQQARENALTAEGYLDAVEGILVTMAFNFYDSLAHLAVYPSMSASQLEPILNRVTKNQEQMNQWATHAPMNGQHKYDLLEAERYRVLEQKTEAIELYDKAIAGAKENEYIQEEALANELAAKFYLDWGKEKIACIYMQEAYYCYARWGAKAKTDYLEKHYPNFLTPIIERQKLNSPSSATVTSLTEGTISKTTKSTGEILDLATLMKASRTLSEEISLEGAIANLMQVAMENAGAETVVLMLFQQEILMLRAIATHKGASPVEPIPIDTSNAAPTSIINKVKRSRETLVLENASNETAYAGDTYIQNHQPQSILCLPLINRGQFIGILYLENNQLPGVFTSDRVEVLNLLCSQAAISLENARLYEESQNYAQQLEKTQLQLVQNEKMASIGELAAGVAHEINNPVGFISGNLTFTSDYIQDLLELLQLYQAELPEPSEIILEKIEDAELDYLIEDLPRGIDSMTKSIERIAEISRSMTTFSRSDTVLKVPFNIHQGIDSTLLILKHRLKANENRPEIEVVKNYGELPEIKCYPGQLNQVFMNLIANAIDALEESNIGQTFEEIETAPNQIIITTEIESKSQQIIIRIRDNGMGMNESVKAQIFEHLFTTKGVGKGTGLGLSISRQIVVEKHGGKLICNSARGEGTEFVIALPKNCGLISCSDDHLQ